MRTLDILTAWILIALGAVQIAVSQYAKPSRRCYRHLRNTKPKNIHESTPFDAYAGLNAEPLAETR